jgi:hypothetical protein
MMNEFPRDFLRVYQEMRGGSQDVVAINGTEYLELVEASGVNPQDYPTCQALNQHKIWQRLDLGALTPVGVEKAIADIQASDTNFHIEGASWTNHLSWVQGYENVLTPMNRLSAAFHEKFDALVAADASVTLRQDYLEALLYNLLVQTSCFRYWGQGAWTDYARRIYDLGMGILVS